MQSLRSALTEMQMEVETGRAASLKLAELEQQLSAKEAAHLHSEVIDWNRLSARHPSCVPYRFEFEFESEFESFVWDRVIVMETVGGVSGESGFAAGGGATAPS